MADDKDMVVRIGSDTDEITLSELQELKKLAQLSKTSRILWSAVIGAGVLVSTAASIYNFFFTK